MENDKLIALRLSLKLLCNIIKSISCKITSFKNNENRDADSFFEVVRFVAKSKHDFELVLHGITDILRKLQVPCDNIMDLLDSMKSMDKNSLLNIEDFCNIDCIFFSFLNKCSCSACNGIYTNHFPNEEKKKKKKNLGLNLSGYSSECSWKISQCHVSPPFVREIIG